MLLMKKKKTYQNTKTKKFESKVTGNLQKDVLPSDYFHLIALESFHIL